MGTVYNNGTINHNFSVPAAQAEHYGIWACNPYISPEGTAAGRIINLSLETPPASGEGWTFADNTYIIEDGADVLVTGTNVGRHIRLPQSVTTVTVTLRDVTMTGTSNYSPLTITPFSTLNLILEGDNTLQGMERMPGIETHPGANLVITGTGNLTAKGATLTTDGGVGAGIGGSGIQGTMSGVSITINSGTVIAQGGSSSNAVGAGIGAGSSTMGTTAGLTLTVNGGTVIATGGQASGNSRRAAGIGAAHISYATTLTMNGNGVIFTSSLTKSMSDAPVIDPCALKKSNLISFSVSWRLRYILSVNSNRSIPVAIIPIGFPPSSKTGVFIHSKKTSRSGL
jgi:hypothetical protein